MSGQVVISGATGLVGGALVQALAASGREVIGLARDPARVAEPARGARFDIDAGEIDAGVFDGAAAVVHLAGASVAERWSAAQRERILNSRVAGTRLVVGAIEAAKQRPPVLVCASAVGFYGDREDEPLDEGSERGEGFLADVCDAWEREARAAEALGVRVVRLRIGMVLSPEGGALGRMLRPFKMGLGGRIGSGKQWVAWIHIDDLVRAIGHVIEHSTLSGAVNATAPIPARNVEMTRALGASLGRPTVLPAPRLALKLLFGSMADELLLASQRALPQRLVESGFEHRFAEIEGALADLLGVETGGGGSSG